MKETLKFENSTHQIPRLSYNYKSEMILLKKFKKDFLSALRNL